MTLRTRLRRLEGKLPDRGCPGCRDRRGRVVTVESQRQADDSITALQPLPPDCVLCGERPEFILEIVRPFMGGKAAWSHGGNA
jgi:hypothetical protein